MNARQRRKQRRIAARNEAFAAAIVANFRVQAMAYTRMEQALGAAITLDDLWDAMAALREVAPLEAGDWFALRIFVPERL